ncbi:DNA replication and repair protein RecF [Bifidobacterium sp. ESL0763]|uniref:DNA replication/repair protein RecF n=1 Tax=Bifidobacterium sp. ESL0763 TaxID=2983227 RepID=UPI0023FA4268|nr:DNA replication and repair protein RecF [Bifidobacterium sp. ESL0763]MDF7663134.1 DNA replication and repair protein RecF [Bifidobacterium sp. ESL0763]
MYISRLVLDHFRSWGHVVVDFTPGINILKGVNGLGKTNVVEAVEMLSTGSSHRVSSTLPLIERGERKATIRANVNEGDAGEAADGEGDVEAGKPTTYEVTIAARGANRGRVNGGPSLYMRDIVGRVSSVSFTPEDQRLVSGDPATRRGFLDQAGALFSPDYAAHLSATTKIARQRVALLKQLQQREETPDRQQAALSGLEVWTGQFIAEGVALTRARAELVRNLAGPFAEIYDRLAGGGQDVGLEYEPSFDEVLQFTDPGPEISRHFQRLYAGEVARGRNLIGPHRDDLAFTLAGMPAREFASNGEMWTLALALKMALFDQIAETRGVRPIVILDDVFAQLDEHRRSQILDFALGQDQVLVTVASGSDIPERAAGLGGVNIIDVGQLREGSDDANAALVAQLKAARGPQDADISEEPSDSGTSGDGEAA